MWGTFSASATPFMGKEVIVDCRKIKRSKLRRPGTINKHFFHDISSQSGAELFLCPLELLTTTTGH